MAAKTKYDNIQILRGLAAMGVVFDHAAMHYFETSDTLIYRLLMFAGYIGVWIFFVISGFIMGVTSFDKFGSKGAPQQFMVRRFLRIAPLYYMVTTAKFVLAHKKLTLPAFLMSLLFIPHFNAEGNIRPILGQGWTLNYEMFFYILFAAAMFMALKRGLIALCSVMVLLVVGGAAMTLAGHKPADALTLTYTDPLLLLFTGGVCVSYLLRSGTQLSSRVADWLSAGLFISLFVLFLIGRAVPSLEISVIPVALAAACILLIFTSAASAIGQGAKSEHGPLYRGMMRLGDASYSIYLTHTFALTFLFKLDDRLHLGSPVIIPLAAVIAIVLGLVVFKTIEAPLGNWLSGRLNPKVKSAAA